MLPTDIHHHKILILDFGSQYTQLIARRIREIGIYSEIMPYDVDESAIKDFKPNGIILSGGPESTTHQDAPKSPEVIYTLNVPILGICYGMQTLAMHYEGKVATSDHQEFGHARLSLLNQANPLFEGVGHSAYLDVWMSHGDKVTQLPADFSILAETPTCPIAVIAHQSLPIWGIQFHPEVTHTEQGEQILRNFAVGICGCETHWTTDNIAEEIIHDLRQQIGADKVVLGLSGGVDSSVVGTLLHKAIGDQLTAVFVDTGLLRLHEGDQVMALFAEHFGMNVIRIDAETRFLDALGEESDPEAKRKIIGRLFVEIFEEEANKISGVKYLAQGTIYPDVIESAGSKTGKAHVIKSHHNVGGLPEHMKLSLVEPIRELFKDEVRRLGTTLGIPHHLLYRHPFPGPGLGVRILGAIKKEYADTLRQADAIFLEELNRSGWYDKTSQAFAVFLPVKSVGVTGDGRRYEHVIALRAVQTIDFMTAHWAHLPYELLSTISNRIINEVRGVSRVVYDVSGKPPATIEWE
ncbi:glutamine-hydrolyzing GMP synthase [Cardiobacteriales bacterium ML27]|uniref:GMP synthase [glutamine-hydrolyzing] n=2 Tax=Ostreibacterium oceani TaxID=2654998 RepID=A0A6N7F4Q1_9GAMM|nr:glutamine-hydrolyzing GMP synthase [Ostreibacterium oceani]MPV86866.1 glutamine-hydrolyzing GMP synthase [Ostreibacterium oceani]